jgi:tRNA(Ile)-lysidine synthase
MALAEHFNRFVQAKQLLTDDRPVLLAVSGGVDSVVMVRLFKDAGVLFSIAHCNFRLRGEESDQDEIFVQSIAAGLEAPFFSKRFDTEAYAETNNLSIQMAARALRYKWFQEVCEANDLACTATAHNLDDMVETALLNFIRGTGLAGLTGIRSRQDGLIRPLLFATRQEIEAFAREKQLAWREDSSNAQDLYARNFVRHRIVPKMTGLNPNFLHTAERNLQRLADTFSNFNHLMASAPGLAGDVWPKDILAAFPAPQQALHHLLQTRGFTEEQARQVAENVNDSGLELHSPDGWRLMVERTVIRLVPGSENAVQPIFIREDDLMIRMPDGASLILMAAEPRPPFPDGCESIIVDLQKLQFPLLLRPWKPGDAFQPFGMGGKHQKLQDFFTNQKLSRLEKEQVWLLENGNGDIIWVLGYRSDERFRIVPETKTALKISRTG